MMNVTLEEVIGSRLLAFHDSVAFLGGFKSVGGMDLLGGG